MIIKKGVLKKGLQWNAKYVDIYDYNQTFNCVQTNDY